MTAKKKKKDFNKQCPYNSKNHQIDRNKSNAQGFFTEHYKTFLREL